MSTLEIRNLHATVGGTEILRGIDLTISSGEVHAIMGPNGSGKSTLSHVVMGRPGYTVTAGSITLDGVDMLSLAPWERAKAGLFLAMQYPTEVPGVSLQSAMAEAFRASGREPEGVGAALEVEADRIGFERKFLGRPLNVDLSGGEKKRNETIQLGVLGPKIAILDELDSGLDVDALHDCSTRIEAMTTEDNLGVLAITHYNRLLKQLRADQVHVMVKGRIVASGGPELAAELEVDGYARFQTVDDPSRPDPLSDVDPFADPLT